MDQKKKILVVGSGLAGTTLAWHLYQKGAEVTLVDDGINFSSRIAAGMINPIVFRRVSKGWRVDEFIPYTHQFYRLLEIETNSQFFCPIVIRRMFSNEHERELWLKKQALSDFENYLAAITDDDMNYSKAINNFGSGRVLNAAFVKTGVFLDAIKTFLRQNAIVLTEVFDHRALIDLRYGGQVYDEIVFCEGYRGIYNPWFSDLPLHTTKGETLTLRSVSLPEDESVNRKCFVLPLGGEEFKIGSTYVWETTSLETSENGKKTLLENLAYLTQEEVQIIDQEAGIRPTTDDRRPLLGTHHTFEHYHVFNGLGTKGYLLAPKLAEEMADFLLCGKVLDPEATINRVYRGR